MVVLILRACEPEGIENNFTSLGELVAHVLKSEVLIEVGAETKDDKISVSSL